MALTPERARRWGGPLGYGIMLLAAVGLWLGVRSFGAGLQAPEPPLSAVRFGVDQAAQPHGPAALLSLLTLLVTVIIAARALGWLVGRLAQPPVIGEILAGILLGPSLLGWVAPGLQARLAPPALTPLLGALAQVGILLFMFLIGLELDPKLFRRRGVAIVGVAHASIVVPFVCGLGLALVLYPRLSTSDVPFGAFALFLGVSLSVTAFPVLARILADRGLSRTPLGVTSLTCAALSDVSAWCLLAAVVAFVQANASGAVAAPLLTLVFVAVMLLVVRPLLGRLARLYGAGERRQQRMFALVVLTLLGAALITEWIGIHAIFGAFVVGACIPHDSGLAEMLTRRIEDLVVVVLLPAFFALTGLKTQLGLLSSVEDWLWCGLIVVVASAGKIGGTLIGAWLARLPRPEAIRLGVLMNTRGLMELIVLDLGLELRVLSPRLFSMLVVMAIVTTMATAPLLALLDRGAAPRRA